ncbi:hypothetical protein AGR1C_Lc80080 [Agrobacterium fabacearum TT111]|nr:hypothetical protein AGR1C_Lc80080 [Agrobacterium fabacearum TT111]
MGEMHGRAERGERRTQNLNAKAAE